MWYTAVLNYACTTLKILIRMYSSHHGTSYAVYLYFHHVATSIFGTLLSSACWKHWWATQRGDTKNKAKKYCLVKIKDTFTLSKKLYCKKKQCLEHTSYVLKVWYHSKAKKPDVHIRCSSYTTVLFFLKTFHWEGIHSRLLSLHEYVAEYLYVHCLTSNWCMI